MKALVFTLLLFSSVLQDVASSKEACGQRIDSSWMWDVIIMHVTSDRHSVLCYGTLVSNEFVVTGAHCLYDLNGDPIDFDHLRVMLADGDHRTVRRTYHPKPFDIEKLDNDFVLVMMSRKVEFHQLVGPVCLPMGDDVPLRNVVVSGIVSKTMMVNDDATCRTNTMTVFKMDFEGALCLGSFSATHKYQRNAGNGLFVNSNGTWVLVGVLMYTTGPTADQVSYAGALQLRKYEKWMKRILKYHSEPSISDNKCQKYMRMLPGGGIGSNQPTINLLELDGGQNVCHGAVISPRFILTTLTCAQKTKRITIKYGYQDSESFDDLTFHYEEWDNKVALIEVARDFRNLGFVISCLWSGRDIESHNFIAETSHRKTFAQPDGINVEYRTDSALKIRYRCSRYMLTSKFAITGDEVTFRKQGESLNRLVGLFDDPLQCSSTDISYEQQKTTSGINIVKYVPWIEEIVWK